MESTNDIYLRWVGSVTGVRPADHDRPCGAALAPRHCSCALLDAETSLAAAVDGFKRRMILRALERAGGSQTRAAKLLGMHQSNLSRLMKTLSLR